MQFEGDPSYHVKPMNCPFHVLVYKSQGRSYRELPMRLGELGGVYRYEQSGVIHGILRARGFHAGPTRTPSAPKTRSRTSSSSISTSSSPGCGISGSTISKPT